MTSHFIRFYPVGNGDTTHLVFANGRRVLFDFCHRPGSEDSETPEIDLNRRLSEELTAAHTDRFDVVAFTHADLDHIQGSTEFFELRHAKCYQGEGRKKVETLWVPAAMLLESADRDSQCDEHILLRKEAWHRLLEGTGILVFSKPEALVSPLTRKLAERGEAANARDHLFVDAGTLVPGFSLAADGVEFFCHSPFIEHCENGDFIRNQAALVFNVRMQVETQIYDYLEVGDATCEDLEDIVRITQYHDNGDRLRWDVFNIPHHCSYLSLARPGDKGERETIPTPLVKTLLLSGQPGAYIVSCSQPMFESPNAYAQIQPPHIQARNAYQRHLNEVGGRRFLVTMEEPYSARPQPIEFELSASGIAWRQALGGAIGTALSQPTRAGGTG